MNYNNPESMYPLQTTDPNSGAFGAGTVPGSFLAGTMMPQRMADYRQAFGNSMQTQELANQKSAAELEDYKLGAGNRALTRDLQQRRLSTDNQMEPQEAKKRAQQLDIDIRAGKHEGEARVWMASQQIPEAKRAAAIRHLTQIGTVLRGMPETTPPNVQMSMLQQAGIDTSDLQAIKDPAELHMKLQAIKALDPEVFKHFADMEKVYFQETQHNGRTADTNATNLQIAQEREGRSSAAGAKVERENKLDDRAREVLVKQGLAEGLSKEEADDFADLAIWQTRTREPNFAAGAKAQGSVDEVRLLLDMFKKNKAQTPPPNNTPPVPKSKLGQALGPRRDITQDEYKKLKKGEKFYFQGKELTKETD